jgi:hypothetical protein
MEQHILVSIFSPNAKQKNQNQTKNPLKPPIFKSSLKQSDRISRSVQNEMMDNISASTMSYRTSSYSLTVCK